MGFSKDILNGTMGGEVDDCLKEMSRHGRHSFHTVNIHSLNIIAE